MGEELQLNDNVKLNIEELQEISNNLYAASFKVKSVLRAIKRGRITNFGVLISKRPFNNRKNTSKRKNKHSRFINEIKKRDYETAKRRANIQ